ncbi:hypothetical protein, partial [Microvirga calopogonii]|uniref:hypothetical protein n=1 Tax=Microvirga calopogonii TaxID=2078013 RepID=UPI00197C5F75
GVNPLHHYLEFGAAEGRDPSPKPPKYQSIRRGPSRRAIAAAAEIIEEFSTSEIDLAWLLKQPLHTLPIAPDLPEAVSDGWRKLYLSLGRVPRTVLIVPSLDDKQLRRHLQCLTNQAIVSSDPSALLVIAADEAFPSIAEDLPHEIVWRSLAEFRAHLNLREKAAILTALIQTLRPESIFIVSSRAGWEVMARHGAAFSRHSQLFAALAPSTCGERNATEDNDVEVDYLEQCLPFLSAVYASDPEWFKKIVERCGLRAASVQKIRFLPAAASDEHWLSVLSQEPGLLSKKVSYL